jgi:prepilin peptidase CpaA
MNTNSLMIAMDSVLAILLLVGAASDLRSRTIPNWLTGGIALLAPITWFASGYNLWPDIAIQLGIGLLFFALFVGVFALGKMGGGDVKLIGALALWFAIIPLVRLLLVMSIVGGVLTVIFWIRHKKSKSEAQLEIPYGVAITIAGLWSLSERYLNHFG